MARSSVKNRILEFAKTRFLRNGFHKISMDRLVSEMRTSKSSLYNHFNSKEALIKAVIDSLNNDINKNLEIILGNDTLNFKGKLIAVSEFTKELLAEVSDEFLKDLEVNTPEIWHYYQETRQQRIDKYYKKLFRSGIKEGSVRKDISSDLILIIYLNLTAIPLRHENTKGLRMSSKSIYEDITEIFLNGILKKP